MADPTIIEIPKDVWVKVADNKLTGQIHQLLVTRNYKYTYRDAGNLAPTDLTDAIDMGPTLEISTTIPIDVYVYCVGKIGKIRADLN